jgi:1-aminocyclopropane-1-carboxylate deaminase/D-cysteine desulfhydrase-like pyridoxal-dependent ACC family enzyme
MQLSGNKVRKLEFLMADAVAQGADCVITIGGIQSNHCRATAVAAKYLNLDCFLILRTSKVNCFLFLTFSSSLCVICFSCLILVIDENCRSLWTKILD